MPKQIYIVFALALLTAAGIPAMCHAMGEKNKTEPAKPAEIVKEAPATSSALVPSGAPNSFADLADNLLPAVVNISSTQKASETPRGNTLQDLIPEMPELPPGFPQDFFEQFLNRRGGGDGGEMSPIPPASLGSGFVIDAEKGYIVTNNHVVKDADEVRVTFTDDTTIKAKIIGKDEKMDLALLKVETDKKLTDVHFGDSDNLRVGDWVLAIGNPFGLGGTVTAGIISAQQRNINAGPYDDFIQTDASINRGNSGGPMFNLKGEVIGINTAIFSPSGGSVGIGFAIPSNLAKSVINQLAEYGRTRRGWIGVRIQSVTEEIAQSLSLDKPRGALVASITAEGPAEKAKLKAGDIITSFDGKAVTEMRHLPRIVAETPIDKKVEITFWRNGKEHTASIEVGELEKAEENGLLAENTAKPKETPSKGTDLSEFGVTVGSVSETARKNFNIPADVTGVVVLKAVPTGEAAKQGLLEGDVIVEINQTPIETPKHASDVVAKAKKDGRPSVLILANREGDVRFLALQFSKDSKKKDEEPVTKDDTSATQEDTPQAE
jgi:serine protease Do